MTFPRWLARMVPFRGGDDEDDLAEKLQTLDESLDASKRIMDDGEQRIMDALGIQADAWRQGRG